MWPDGSADPFAGLTTHPESWVRFEDIGKRAFAYHRNFEAEPPALKHLQDVLRADVAARGVPCGGATAPACLATSLKLAELAALAHGNVLEFTARDGFSTALLARALRARPRPGRILGRFRSRARLLSIDDDGVRQRGTIDRIGREGLSGHVKFAAVPATIAAYGSIEAETRYGLCFVDHAAAYEQMVALCRLMRDLVDRGGFVVIGNYLVFEDGDTPAPDRGLVEGIHRAVRDGLDSRRFAFIGCYGTCAVFLKIEPRPRRDCRDSIDTPSRGSKRR